MAATVIRFDDFSVADSLTLNGDAQTTATQDGTVLRLARATGGVSGSAFNSVQVNAADFSTFFSFRITNPGGASDSYGEAGADGLVFVVQSVSSSLGGTGEGLGYGGIGKSVGVEFDTFGNAGGNWNQLNDPSSNHVGIDTLGNINHGVGAPDTANIDTDFDNGNLWYAWVDYDGTELEVRVSTTAVRPTTPTLARELDVPALLEGDTAFIGFTAATGLAWGNHDIVRWEYRTEYDPIIVAPEVSVTFNGTDIGDGDTTPATADGTDFGTSNVGDATSAHVFTVTNTGQSALNTSNLSLPAGFTLVNGLASSILPGESDTFSVKLNTANAGTFSGNISFANNDSDENPFNFAIKGTVQGVAVPLSAVAGGPYVLNEGSSLSLDGSASTGATGYSWDINGDGTFGDATGATPTITWTSLTSLGIDDGPGTYSVKVRVTDGVATIDSPATTLTVKNVAPTATFTGGAAVVLGAASGVTFSNPTDVAADLPTLVYSYDFNNDGDFTDAGDVDATSATTASFVFGTTGAHIVHGRVTDKDGGFTDYTTTVTVNGNTTPPPVPTLSIDNVTANEGDSGTTDFTFTVTRAGDTSGASSAIYQTIGGTATPGSDYGDAFGNVTFAAGETSKTITVAVNGDTTVEADETFNVVLTSPTNATLLDDTGVGTIVNDDAIVEPPTGNTTLAIQTASVTEGTGAGFTSVSIEVIRAGDLSGASRVKWVAVDGSASESDFNIGSGFIDFAAGERSKFIDLQVVADSINEGTESFRVLLTKPTGATIIDSNGKVTILDDDAKPLTVSILDWQRKEGNNGTKSLIFSVRLNRATLASETVSVDYATAPGTALDGSDFVGSTGTVTFAAGSKRQTIVVTLTSDKVAEGDETLSVNLLNPVNVSIVDGDATGTIINND